MAKGWFVLLLVLCFGGLAWATPMSQWATSASASDVASTAAAGWWNHPASNAVGAPDQLSWYNKWPWDSATVLTLNFDVPVIATGCTIYIAPDDPTSQQLYRIDAVGGDTSTVWTNAGGSLSYTSETPYATVSWNPTATPVSSLRLYFNDPAVGGASWDNVDAVALTSVPEPASLGLLTLGGLLLRRRIS